MKNGSEHPQVTVHPASGVEQYARGCSLWLPPRDARRIAVLAREWQCSISEALERIIADEFRRRF